MTSFIARQKSLRSCMVAIMCLLSLQTQGANLQVKQDAFEIPQKVSALLPNKHAQINARTQRALTQSWEDFEQQHHEKALSTLSRIIEENLNNPVAVSYALQSASQILSQQERHSEAIKLIQEVLRLDSLSENSLLSQRFLLAQLFVQEARYEEASQSLGKLIGSSKTDTDQHQHQQHRQPQQQQRAEWHYLLSFCQFQIKQYGDSIHNASQALGLNHPAKEELYQLQLNGYLSLKDYVSSNQIIQTLITLKPDQKYYWQQMIRIALALGDDKATLAAFELFRKSHALSGEETRHYAQLLLRSGLPERSASALDNAIERKVLEKNSETLALLAYSWEQAGHSEKAIKALSNSKLITNYQDTPQNLRILNQLTQLLSKQASWEALNKLIDSVTNRDLENWLRSEQGLSKEKLRTGLLYGHSLVNANQQEAARKAFDTIDRVYANTDLDQATREQLKQWRNYFQSLDGYSAKT